MVEDGFQDLFHQKGERSWVVAYREGSASQEYFGEMLGIDWETCPKP